MRQLFYRGFVEKRARLRQVRRCCVFVKNRPPYLCHSYVWDIVMAFTASQQKRPRSHPLQRKRGRLVND